MGTEHLDLDVETVCDFCGMPINGVSYERLDDGRIRCGTCSASAIDDFEEFRTLFSQSVQMMESIFGIEYRKSVSIKLINARALNRAVGRVYRPEEKMTSRTVGYAQFKDGAFSVNIENGSPRLATIDTIVHEMTHIWQYINWDRKEIAKMYSEYKNMLGHSAVDAVYEGMAVWASIQYLYIIGEESYAYQLEERFKADNSVYGVGFLYYSKKYPLVKDRSLLGKTPFNVYPPIEFYEVPLGEDGIVG